MRFRAVPALVFALALAGCASKAPAPVAPSQAEWDAVTAADFTCKPSEYRDATFAAVRAAPQAFYEKCLRLHALFAKTILVKDAASLPATGAAARATDTMIGVFFKDPAQAQRLGNHPQFVIASGRLRACGERARKLRELADREKAAYAPKPGEPYKGLIRVIAAEGYCQYSGGPALYVTDITAMPTAMD